MGSGHMETSCEELLGGGVVTSGYKWGGRRRGLRCIQLGASIFAMVSVLLTLRCGISDLAVWARTSYGLDVFLVWDRYSGQVAIRAYGR